MKRLVLLLTLLPGTLFAQSSPQAVVEHGYAEAVTYLTQMKGQWELDQRRIAELQTRLTTLQQQLDEKNKTEAKDNTLPPKSTTGP